MKYLLLAGVAALALAGCSKSGNADINHGGSVTIPGANGTSSTISKQVPANLPDYVKIYPGAVVTAVMDNGPNGGVIAFDVADPPETVMDFYKKDAADAKLDSALDSWGLNQDHTGAHVVMFSHEGSKRSLSTTVELRDGKTHVGLMYGAAS